MSELPHAPLPCSWIHGRRSDPYDGDACLGMVAAPRVTSTPRSPPGPSTLGTSRSRTGALVMDSPLSSSKGAGQRWTYGIR